MKRILSFLMVVCIAFALALPAFANNDIPTTYASRPAGTLVGGWLFDDIYSQQNWGWGYYHQITFLCDGVTYAGLQTAESGTQLTYFITKDGESVLVRQDETWLDQKYRLIEVTDDSLLDDGMRGRIYDAWLDVAERVCTGTTCPASDANIDNVCDDCGMTFAVMRNYAPPDPYTIWTETRQEAYPYAFVWYDSNSNATLHLASQKPYYEAGRVIVPPNSVSYSVFGSDWRLISSYTDSRSYETTAVLPSFNLLDSDGNVAFPHDNDFFPKPLWLTTLELTQGIIPKFQVTTGQTMMTLTVFSVGCLALLIGCSLFGKVLRTFLR